MKKVILSAVVIIAFIAYALHQRLEGSDAVKAVVPKSTSNVSSQSSNSQTTASAYKDGTYTGSSADAYYGNVQVKAIIQGGKITDVQFLDYPQDRGESVEINTAAMPSLKSEAIQAQSANVDVVSGASQTSGAFKVSLQSALDQAKS